MPTSGHVPFRLAIAVRTTAESRAAVAARPSRFGLDKMVRINGSSLGSACPNRLSRHGLTNCRTDGAPSSSLCWTNYVLADLVVQTAQFCEAKCDKPVLTPSVPQKLACIIQHQKTTQTKRMPEIPEF